MSRAQHLLCAFVATCAVSSAGALGVNSRLVAAGTQASAERAASPQPTRSVNDVDFRLIVLDTPSGSDLTTLLPTSITKIAAEQTYYLEVWVSDVGDINTGMTSAYVDMTFPANAASVVDISHGTLFTVFPSGSLVTGGIDELGGSALPGGIGVEPVWARVVVVEMHADASPPSVTFELLASSTGVAALGRGQISWYNILLDTVCIVLGDLDGDNDVDLADLAQLLGNYGMTSGAAYEDGDLDGDGDVDLADLAALLAVYGTTCE